MQSELICASLSFRETALGAWKKTALLVSLNVAKDVHEAQMRETNQALTEQIPEVTVADEVVSHCLILARGNAFEAQHGMGGERLGRCIREC